MNFKEFNLLRDHQKGVLALIWLTSIYACMGLFVRWLNTSFELYQQMYLRISMAFVLSLVFFNKDLHLSKLKSISKKEWLLFIVRAAAFYLIGINLFTRALLLTKYSNVSFISSIPLTAVFGFLLFHEKVTLKKCLLILLAFLGVVLISVKDYSNLLNWNVGDLLALLSSIGFSFGYVSRKWHSPLLSNKEITTITFFFGMIMLFVASISSGEPLPIHNWTPLLLLGVFLAGLFNVLNNFLSNYGFQKVEVVLASNILTMESFFAVLIGFTFFREVPALKEFLGGLMIVFSVFLMNKVESGEAKTTGS